MTDSVGGGRVAAVRAIDLKKPRHLAHAATLEPRRRFPIARAGLRSASIRRQPYLARTLPRRDFPRFERPSAGPALAFLTLPRPTSPARSARQARPARADIRPA